jgi:hypothetical protein
VNKGRKHKGEACDNEEVPATREMADMEGAIENLNVEPIATVQCTCLPTITPSISVTSGL